MNLKDLNMPVFMMNIPLSYSTDVRNNVWMDEYDDKDIIVNKEKAIREMWEVYSFLSSQGFVYLLPTPNNCSLQDLVFVANNGIMLNHLDNPVYIGSNFTAKNRIGEEKIGMDFFTSMYSLSNLAIVHGLRGVETDKYKSIISINTILRKEILNIKNVPTPNIYCVLGGGTVNVGAQFAESTIQMAKLCVEAASYLKDYTMHIICSSDNIYKKLSSGVPTNVQLHKEIIDSEEYYSKACLVITRSGRNTLSELAYLGIPAISFVSGCSYRKAEQEQNLKSLNATNICSAEIDISAKDFADLCIKQQSYRQECPKFIIGNLTAVSEILSL